MVGCIRELTLHDGGIARERLVMLDDSRYRFTYNFETPPFPVANYLSTLELIPVTNGDVTYARWSATFDEKPEDTGRYVDVVSNGIFAPGLAGLASRLRGTTVSAPGLRWQGPPSGKSLLLVGDPGIAQTRLAGDAELRRHGWLASGNQGHAHAG